MEEAERIKPRFISLSNLTKYLGISESSIRRLMNQDKIPYFRIEGRIVFDFKEIQKWVEEKKVSNG